MSRQVKRKLETQLSLSDESFPSSSEIPLNNEEKQKQEEGEDTIQEELKCCICSQLLSNPVQLSCKHSFCMDCSVHWWKSKTKEMYDEFLAHGFDVFKEKYILQFPFLESIGQDYPEGSRYRKIEELLSIYCQCPNCRKWCSIFHFKPETPMALVSLQVFTRKQNCQGFECQTCPSKVKMVPFEYSKHYVECGLRKHFSCIRCSQSLTHLFEKFPLSMTSNVLAPDLNEDMKKENYSMELFTRQIKKVLDHHRKHECSQLSCEVEGCLWKGSFANFHIHSNFHILFENYRTMASLLPSEESKEKWVQSWETIREACPEDWKVSAASVSLSQDEEFEFFLEGDDDEEEETEPEPILLSSSSSSASSYISAQIQNFSIQETNVSSSSSSSNSNSTSNSF